MTIKEAVTGVVVCWNTKDLIERAYNSIRKFHTEMKIVIVDGSDKGSLCYHFTESLVGPDTEVYHVGYNIGHGRGMDFGINHVKTPYVLFFDSDIVMVKSPLHGMLGMMESDTFGVGYIEKTGLDGFDFGAHAHHLGEPAIKYMHPYFQLVQVSEYRKHAPYIHHGAPCIGAMVDLYHKGLADKALKEYPGLGHTTGMGFSWKPVAGEYILHDVANFGGTGKFRISQGLPHIEGEWEAV